MRSFFMTAGETKTAEVDFSGFAGRYSTTVSGVTWDVVSGAGLVTEAALLSGLAQCKITTRDCGKTEIKCTATMADGQVAVEEITIITKGFC